MVKNSLDFPFFCEKFMEKKRKMKENIESVYVFFIPWPCLFFIRSMNRREQVREVYIHIYMIQTASLLPLATPDWTNQHCHHRCVLRPWAQLTHVYKHLYISQFTTSPSFSHSTKLPSTKRIQSNMSQRIFLFF